MELLMTTYVKILRYFFFFSQFFLFSFSVFANNSVEIESNWNSRIGPFTSKFQTPLGWNTGNDALSKSASLYEREGMTAKIDFAMTFGQEGILIASWQDFTYPTAAEVAQLTNEIPPLPGVKRSDIKMSVEVASNATKFEYAFFKGVGAGDNFSITGKGKKRYTGYWVHMPIQYKDSKGNLLSGMLSIFARVNESQTNKLKVDSIINGFISSLDFDNDFRKISYEAHRKEVIEANIRKKIESELAQSVNKDVKPSSSIEQPSTSTTLPVIKQIYMVDADDNCYSFIENAGFKKTNCPDHKLKK
jgi:hypothetical protein